MTSSLAALRAGRKPAVIPTTPLKTKPSTTAPVWITAACFALFGVILNRTVFGRDTLAVGGNAEAAHLAGIAVDRVKIAIFPAQGAMAAFGFGEVERQYVVVDAEQFGHLADQLVLHALGGELVGLRVELRQHLLKEVIEVLYQ